LTRRPAAPADRSAQGISVARVSQIEKGDVSTRDVLGRYVTALGGTLRLVADFGDERLKGELIATTGTGLSDAETPAPVYTKFQR
jgi:hypothetical protein